MFGWIDWAETLERLIQFKRTADSDSQDEIMDGVIRQYPKKTRFVVLPMDMEPMGYGPVQESIEAQHNDLARMASQKRFKGRVIPFATIHGGRADPYPEVERCIKELNFKGLKIYPRMGFDPTHSKLTKIYQLLEKHNLPVMTHCSRGGVIGRGIVPGKGDRFTMPDTYLPLFSDHKTLRICLAHFGGQRDWQDYVDNGYDPDDVSEANSNWQIRIRRLIGSGDYLNLWTDISYTLFRFDEFIPFLRLFLLGDGTASERLRRRVLFGSDFYMTRQEELSERAVCFRLRNALGEEVFRQIA